MYSIFDTVQVWVVVFFFFLSSLIGIQMCGTSFAAAIAAFIPLIARQGSQGGENSGRCPCLQGKVLRCSVCPTCVVLVTPSCSPHSLLGSQLTWTVSACFCFPPFPVWPSWLVFFSLWHRSHQVVLFPNSMPSFALQHSRALGEGFYRVWYCGGACFDGQLCQVVRGFASCHMFTLESVFFEARLFHVT